MSRLPAYPFLLVAGPGREYFHITTREGLYKVALRLLAERNGHGFYVTVMESPSPSVTRVQLRNIGPGKVRDLAVEEHRQYTEACRRWAVDTNFERDVRKALKEKNGKAAWALLRKRGRRSGEMVDVEIYSDVPA